LLRSLAILMKGRGSWMIGAVIGSASSRSSSPPKGAALFHGVVFSALPAGVGRGAAIVVGLASGFAAVCAGGVRLPVRHGCRPTWAQDGPRSKNPPIAG
jgi:hypothetical protein